MPNQTPEDSGKPSSDEARLLSDVRELLGRAGRLVTQTSKMKIWVPIVCSIVLTCYYLYAFHQKTPSAANLTMPGEPAAAVVAEPAPISQTGAPTTGAQPMTQSSAASEPETEIGYAEIRKEAEQAHASQQFADEAKLWQQFMERSPLPQEACPAIGKAYERIGDIDTSIRAYERCVSIEPGNVDILVAFAHALQTNRDFDRAASLYRRVLLKDPGNLDARNGLALNELKQDHLREADQAVKSILEKAPDNTDALLIEGIVAWRQARLPDAEKIFLKGTALDDRRPDFHAFLGRIAEAERRPQDALREYEKALVLDPGDADIAERRSRLQEAR